MNEPLESTGPTRVEQLEEIIRVLLVHIEKLRAVELDEKELYLLYSMLNDRQREAEYAGTPRSHPACKFRFRLLNKLSDLLIDAQRRKRLMPPWRGVRRKSEEATP